MIGGQALQRVATTAVLVVAASLAGCAPQPGEYGSEVSETLKSEVLEVSQLAAEDKFPSALLALTELEALLKDSRARGLVTDERYESVLAAIELVRADLDAAIAAQEQPSPAPEPDEGDNGDDDEGNRGNSGKNGNNGNGNNGNNGNDGKGNSGNNGRGND